MQSAPAIAPTVQYSHNNNDNLMQRKKNRKIEKLKKKTEKKKTNHNQEGKSRGAKHITCRTYASLGSSCTI